MLSGQLLLQPQLVSNINLHLSRARIREHKIPQLWLPCQP